MSQTATLEVKTVAELKQQPEEYQSAVEKIVVSHAVNELYGAQVFDEPAIQLAPPPTPSGSPAAWRWRNTAITSASGNWAKR